MSSVPLLEVPRRSRIVSSCLVILGAGIAIYGLRSAPDRTWPNLLLGGFYVTSLALSAMFFFATQRLTGARWSANLRRIPEAYALGLPVFTVLMLALYFGWQFIYPWSRPGVFAHAPSIAGKAHYLKPAWVFARMALALLSWSFFALLFRKTSLDQDRNPDSSLVLHQRLTRYTVWFVFVFALTFTWSCFDWLVSLDPEWFTTMFAVYVFAGTFVQGIAAVTLAAVLLRQRGFLRNTVSDDQLHDLGKMLFAFTTFWAYIWLCQYLLIWYGNLPEEVSYYLKRTNGPWLYLFALNLTVNWIIPFIVLLSARAKRMPKILAMMSVLLLCGHWLDLYLLIMPAVWSVPRIGVFEIFITTGCLALLYLIFIHGLARAPLVPLNDPVLAYEKLHTQRQDCME